MTRNGLRYQRHCMALSSSLVWGAFSMAAVMYDRDRLLRSAGALAEGRPHDEIPYDYAEGQYAVRVGLAGLCTARGSITCSWNWHKSMPASRTRKKKATRHPVLPLAGKSR